MGDALLIHPRDRFDERAAAFAGGIAEDPLHTLAVVDLPGDAVATEWAAVARLLSAARYGSPRLVFGRGTPADVRTACRHIADRLEREVLAPDGDLVPTVGGGLFVPGDDGAAWLRFRPGHDPEPVAQRFPKPHWEFSAPARTQRAGTHAVAQPLPAGVWLRHAGPDPLAAHHRRAVEAAPTDPHHYLVVLGSPGTPPLSAADVARFWDTTVLPGARPAVRFVLYGTLDVPGGHTAPGQALADALGHPAVLYDGLPGDRAAPAGTTYLPIGFAPPAPDPGGAVLPPRPAAPPVRTESGTAGAPGAHCAPDTASSPELPAEHDAEGATDLSEAPTVRNTAGTDTGTDAVGEGGDEGGSGGPAAGSGAGPGSGAADLDEAPTVRSRSRATPKGTPAGTPGIEAPSASAATSTRTSRPAPEPRPVPSADPTPAPATAAPALAQRPVPPASPRFRLESAAPEPEIGEIGEIHDVHGIGGIGGIGEDGAAPPAAVPAPGPVPAQGSGKSGRADVPSVSGRAGAVRVQPVPRAAACALPPERGVAQERDWMRRTFSEQYNALAGSVSRVMSESPGLRGRSRTEAADALTDLVAVRLYLSGDARRADAAVRAAVPGPHVPLARCVTAGLRRLPSYRGPALLRTRLGAAERAWYREGALVTEWAFCHARTSLHPGPRGSDATDVLIWSMTARRTSSLDPDVPDRVVFLPGTVFKVLRADGPAVLMRELSPSEASEAAQAAEDTREGRDSRDGRGDVTAKLDEIAVKGLEKILDALERTGTDAAAGSADPPGLIVTHRAVRTEGAEP
ncbi:hypothetical protein [Streptomyces sp. NPDC086777]|uniref:hypothetical protein n=1 Tax=Streptomyces sp. NPDC086777 TaxID=3154866 RepID=UPI00344DE5FD